MRVTGASARSGVVNSRDGVTDAAKSAACEPSGCSLRFSYTFNHPDSNEFVGWYASLGRVSIETANPDGTAGPVLSLLNEGFDLRDLSVGTGEVVSIDAIAALVGGDPTNTVRVLLEVQDIHGARASQSFTVPAGSALTRYEFPVSGFVGIDLGGVKLLTLLVAESSNPSTAALSVRSIALVDKNGAPRDACVACRVVRPRIGRSVGSRRLRSDAAPARPEDRLLARSHPVP